MKKFKGLYIYMSMSMKTYEVLSDNKLLSDVLVESRILIG